MNLGKQKIEVYARLSHAALYYIALHYSKVKCGFIMLSLKR